MEENKIFMAQQPILDKNVNIFGYEFFSRSTFESVKAEETHSASSDTKALFNLFSNFNTEDLLKGKKAFLNCVLEDSGSTDYFDLLPPTNVVLEVAKPSEPENMAIVRAIVEKIIELKSKGYIFAGSNFVFANGYEKWFEALSFVKFDALDSENYKESISNMEKAKKAGKKVIAEKVETRTQYEFLKKFDFDYYQGYFFSKPITLAAKVNNPAINNLFKLINLVIAEAETKDIENVLKTDTVISFKLLRYLNSYGVGGGEKVETFNRAIQILGYKKLLKWLTILFSAFDKKEGSDAISKMALIRAKFMENMALEMDKKEADNYFMVGLFSMLDSILGVSIDVALNSINVSDDLKEAVLNSSGKYWNLLNLAKLLENDDWIEIFAIFYQLNMKSDNVSKHYMEAIQWVNGLELG